ncbi:Phosphate import ATP-binding protein, partial [Fusarium albosuccineum]
MEPNQNPSTPKNNKKKGESKKNKNKVSSQKSQPCFQFQNSGQCRFGDSCKFAHEPPPANQQIHHDPMDLFFAEYPSFDYQRNKPFYSEFYRMCHQFSWDKNDKSRREAFDEFRIALVEQFNTIYGTDENSLESWQLLCRTLGIGVPETLKEAQK